MSITTVATATRRTAREAVTSYITLTMMFVAALAGTLLHRAGGKDSDRGPSTSSTSSSPSWLSAPPPQPVRSSSARSCPAQTQSPTEIRQRCIDWRDGEYVTYLVRVFQAAAMVAVAAVLVQLGIDSWPWPYIPIPS